METTGIIGAGNVGNALAHELVKDVGALLAGKIVVDVTNAIDAGMTLAVGFTTSGAIQFGYVLGRGTQIGFKLLQA
ncbi:MAG: hypothetical protein Q8N23_32195 [Archangium sp.]|nr:hypothetical protein [Archangium sp.]MDP3157374.1 hypothetical protein [Archangium sp.]MDP3571212.1 hypothetical protein [Archangium sp.]